MKREDFKRITPYIYEVPQSYRADMRAPARFYADAELMEAALDDRSLDQLVNTATLPGVVKYALAMPDIHQGYGFPIGGVVATELPDGVISPGGVGYDINCLAGDTLVLHADGYTLPIADMAATWSMSRLRCQNFASGQDDTTAVVRYLKQRPSRPVQRLRTEEGDEIIATADHPFWTPEGMVALENVAVGDKIGRIPFHGVPYEQPPDQVLVDEQTITRLLQAQNRGAAGNAQAQIVAHLSRRGLLPLRPSAPQFAPLLKLLGYLFGDGTVYFSGGNGKGVTWFYGDEADLESVRAAITAVGFTPSSVYKRRRQHRIQTPYDTYEFEREETAVKVSGSAFAALLVALGLPVGAKAAQDYALPRWLFRLPLWQKRLFLAAFFGAELTAPRAFSARNNNFYAPVLALNKHAPFEASGRQLLRDVAALLAEFGVETTRISRRTEQINADKSQSIRLRLLFASNAKNLIKLWGRIGYEFNRKRQRLAALAVAYLQRKAQVVAQRNAAAARAATLQTAGVTPQAIFAELEGESVNRRFLERSLYEGRATSARAGARFETFAEFCDWADAGLQDSSMVWTKIAAIEAVDLVQEGHDGYVYDFTVAHPDHNFVANGFVVSNCGVRLLGTRLDEEEVAPYLDELANQLQRNCPHGVGRGGNVRLKRNELIRLMEQGGRWALKNGFATQMDLLHTEEEGSMEGANPAMVSDRAIQRGLDQVGTLGAGNHFIEVDRVEEIFDATAAQRMGLFPGQVVVQIHCGSRGLGHQICSDYVKRFQPLVHKYGITLPDRELVCAPLSSPEGQEYLAAMKCAANYAFVNRQVLTHLIRQSFEDALAGKVNNFSVYQVYDIAHNMAKIERHEVDGRQLTVCVHRKGATRAFGPGSPVLPDAYRDIGQPVLVPGSMGTASWVLVGTEKSMAQSFGSTCHGAGRVMSRTQAKRSVRGSELRQELEERGIRVRAGSLSGLAEEAPQAYKDVDRVIEVVHGAGIARKVARIVPLAVIKG